MSLLLGESAAGAEGRPSRRRRPPARGRTELAGAWGLLALALVTATLALGAQHPVVLLGVASLVFASLGLVWWHAPDARSLPLPALLLLGLSTFSFLQALPLGGTVVRALSPASAEIWARAVELTGSSARASLSLDPGASFVEALKWSMYAAAFTTAGVVARVINVNRALFLPLGAALLLALVTLSHGLVGTKAVYGFYEPSFGSSPWHVSPLLNPNHLAGYLNFGVFCGLGLLVSRRTGLPRWVFGASVAVLIPSAIVAGSRGGIVGLAVGLVTFLLALPGRRSSDPVLGSISRPSVFASIGAVALLASVFTGLLASSTTLKELLGTNVEKLQVLAWSKPLIEDYAWVGVGRGAFDGVSSTYKTLSNNGVFTHPENLLVQWVGEWGAPVGASALLGLGWLLRPARLGRRFSAGAAGVTAGTVALLSQNFVDFGLEVPAVALCVVIALGACWGFAADQVGNRSLQLSPRWLIVLSAFFALTLLATTVKGLRPLWSEREELGDSYAASRKDRAQVRNLQADVRAAVARHPADPYLYRLGALLATRSGGEPMPWLQRALERGPSVGRTHLLASRVLLKRRARSQALLELKLAASFDPALAPIVAQHALRITSNPVDLMRAVPSGPEGNAVLVELADLLTAPAQGTSRQQLLREALSRDGRDADALRRLAGDAVAALEKDDAGRCSGEARPGCVEQVHAVLPAFRRVGSGAAASAVLQARFLIATGKADEGLKGLRAECDRLVDRERSICLRTQLELSTRHANSSEFNEDVKAFLVDHCASPDTCTRALERAGDLSVKRGQHYEALSLYERASRELPNDALWLKLAEAALQVGATRRAGTALDRVRERTGARYARLKRALAQQEKTIDLKEAAQMP